jgi:hypothetical protein
MLDGAFGRDALDRTVLQQPGFVGWGRALARAGSWAGVVDRGRWGGGEKDGRPDRGGGLLDGGLRGRGLGWCGFGLPRRVIGAIGADDLIDGGVDLGGGGDHVKFVRLRGCGRREWFRGGRFGREVAAPLEHGALTLVGGAVQGVGSAIGLHFLAHRHVGAGGVAEQSDGGHGEGDGAGGVDVVCLGLWFIGADGADGDQPGVAVVDGVVREQRDEVAGQDEWKAVEGIDAWAGLRGGVGIGHWTRGLG